MWFLEGINMYVGDAELWRVLERLKCHTREPFRLRRRSRCRCAR